MKNEINEHRLRLNILEKHISSDFYKTGHLHNKISDAMKEYAEQVNDVDTSHDKALNLAGVSASLLNQIQIQRDIYKEREAKAFDIANHREAYENSIKSSTVDQVLLIIDSYAR